MKTARLRQQVKNYLRHGPKSTTEVLEYINNNSRHGTTTQQLSNVLGKDRDIVKIGYIKKKGAKYGSYHISEWALADNVPADAFIVPSRGHTNQSDYVRECNKPTPKVKEVITVYDIALRSKVGGEPKRHTPEQEAEIVEYVKGYITFKDVAVSSLRYRLGDDLGFTKHLSTLETFLGKYNDFEIISNYDGKNIVTLPNRNGDANTLIEKIVECLGEVDGKSFDEIDRYIEEEHGEVSRAYLKGFLMSMPCVYKGMQRKKGLWVLHSNYKNRLKKGDTVDMWVDELIDMGTNVLTKEDKTISSVIKRIYEES